jgi:hypothetical protein
MARYAVKPLTGSPVTWASDQGNSPELAARNYVKNYGQTYAVDGVLLVAVGKELQWGTIDAVDIHGFKITYDEVSITAL